VKSEPNNLPINVDGSVLTQAISWSG